jgi:hypothetical protein
MYRGYWFSGRRKNGKIPLLTMVDPLSQWSIPFHNGRFPFHNGRFPLEELSLDNKYACLQLDTCHVGSYSETLVPYFRT